MVCGNIIYTSVAGGFDVYVLPISMKRIAVKAY